jgi:hypothetical protein
MTYLGEGELLVGNELDCSLVHIAGAIVVLGIYLFKSSILKPYCRSAWRRVEKVGVTHNTVDRKRDMVSYVKHDQLLGHTIYLLHNLHVS